METQHVSWMLIVVIGLVEGALTIMAFPKEKLWLQAITNSILGVFSAVGATAFVVLVFPYYPSGLEYVFAAITSLFVLGIVEVASQNKPFQEGQHRGKPRFYP